MNNIEYLKKYYKGNLEEGINRLEQGEPVQYIVGNVEFYGYNFLVNKNVLIPRFETEELVKYTIDIVNDKFKNKIVNILDIGTGSGCIAITLKKEIKKCNVTAIDISDKALEVAKKNAKINNVDIKFVIGDTLNNIKEKYDIIISNPPYIKDNEEIEELVKNNEPHIALYAGIDGLDVYKKILKQANKNIKDKYLIAFEMGETQGKDIQMLSEMYLNNKTCEIKKDIYGRDRFIFISNFE